MLSWKLILWIVLLEVASVPAIGLMANWIFAAYYSQKKNYELRMRDNTNEDENDI